MSNIMKRTSKKISLILVLIVGINILPANILQANFLEAYIHQKNSIQTFSSKESYIQEKNQQEKQIHPISIQESDIQEKIQQEKKIHPARAQESFTQEKLQQEKQITSVQNNFIATEIQQEKQMQSTGFQENSIHAKVQSKNLNDVNKTKRMNYGVFIGADKPNYKKMGKFDTVVIDAEYFTSKQLAKLKKSGCKKIYSYLDIGSLEDFRDYFKDYEDFILGEYDNWPGEYWIDVSNDDWQELCVSRAKAFKKKGVDGFFLDNCDVYYQYTEKSIYNGLTAILSGIKKLGGKVIINGGDVFVRRLIKDRKTKIFDGVNQESVYTAIDFEKNTFKTAKAEDREYFTNYLKKVKKADKKVYVLEYATSTRIRSAAKKYAKKYGWTVYVSDSLRLSI